jgi:hypothetical protein
MQKLVTDNMRDRKTPQEVEIRAEARKPETDPTLGIRPELKDIVNQRPGTPRHRLVTIGDSLTQGFQSGAIFNTKLSYPMIIAREMGWSQMRYPTYGGPGDGLPLNLEWLARQLERQFGESINVLDFTPALLHLRGLLDKVEDYWERGEGSRLPTQQEINHNLAIYGWDLRNTLARNADICQHVLTTHPPKDDFFRQVVEHHNERATLQVLYSARDSQRRSLTPLQAAAALGAEGTQETNDGDGIETLIVLIGSNNALGSILTFNLKWSGDDYADMEENDKYTVWQPSHFQAELNQVVEEVKKIRARHVIWGTVPHVTIAPFARGVNKDEQGNKARPGSRYFPYYSLPWIKQEDFDPSKHPHLTGQEARAIDSAIDQYNNSITEVVRQGRKDGRDWYLFETAGLLDRLASRRYLEDVLARPSWWDEVGGAYPLPFPLQALQPVPDSRFYRANSKGRIEGGLFSLDGIHPTTIGYGIMAQEFIKIMQLAGVKFYQSDGKTERTGEVNVNFNRLIALDSLISNPPRSLASTVDLIGWIDKNLNLFSRLLMNSY